MCPKMNFIQQVLEKYQIAANCCAEPLLRLNEVSSLALQESSPPRKEVNAILRKKFNEKTNQTEWALLSRKKPHRVLRWFGARKPSEERVAKEEKRIQFFKHKG